MADEACTPTSNSAEDSELTLLGILRKRKRAVSSATRDENRDDDGALSDEYEYLCEWEGGSLPLWETAEDLANWGFQKEMTEFDLRATRRTAPSLSASSSCSAATSLPAVEAGTLERLLIERIPQPGASILGHVVGTARSSYCSLLRYMPLNALKLERLFVHHWLLKDASCIPQLAFYAVEEVSVIHDIVAHGLAPCGAKPDIVRVSGDVGVCVQASTTRLLILCALLTSSTFRDPSSPPQWDGKWLELPLALCRSVTAPLWLLQVKQRHELTDYDQFFAKEPQCAATLQELMSVAQGEEDASA